MNDIGGGAAAPQIIAAMQQVIDRVHAKGLLIIGGTLFPLARSEPTRWPAAMEAQRLAVNTWIRTQANYDAVVDFDRLMRGGPVYTGNASLKPEFACDDNVHPNASGYRAMGEFVDLTLFRSPKRELSRTHHIHMVERQFVEDWGRLLFRDYLVQHADVATEYENLKRQLASASPKDRIAYTRGKTEFITTVTKLASRR